MGMLKIAQELRPDRAAARHTSCRGGGSLDLLGGELTGFDARPAAWQVFIPFYADCNHLLRALVAEVKLPLFERLNVSCTEDIPTRPLIDAIGRAGCCASTTPWIRFRIRAERLECFSLLEHAPCRICAKSACFYHGSTSSALACFPYTIRESGGRAESTLRGVRFAPNCI